MQLNTSFPRKPWCGSQGRACRDKRQKIVKQDTVYDPGNVISFGLLVCRPNNKINASLCYDLTIQIAYVERGTLGKSSNSRGLLV